MTLCVISLGAGVQSSTLLLMAESGEIEPRPDCAIFADTQGEPQAVYDWIDYLEFCTSIPIHRVTRGSLWKSATRVRRTLDGERTYIQTAIPIYYTQDGVSRGIGKRHCTNDFKIGPVNKKLRELLGLHRVNKRDYERGPLAEMWIGISEDEASRMKPSRLPWVYTRWPLIEKGMTRKDCLSWLKSKGFMQPPKSSCTFCPFHNDAAWKRLTPLEIKDCAEKELQLQKAYASASEVKGVPYFHPSRKPLSSIDFTDADDDDDTKFTNECAGFCGV